MLLLCQGLKDPERENSTPDPTAGDGETSDLGLARIYVRTASILIVLARIFTALLQKGHFFIQSLFG